MRFCNPSGLICPLLAVLPLLAGAVEVAPFDLAGPTIEIEVTRGTRTLPIARVPNLAAGDRLWIRAALPDSQSVRYLLVVAFLRGSTDPPPHDWFFRCDTWSGACARQGMTLTVPGEARQALLFLAPKTGGDFSTLVSAVRGRPGIFVRSSQELIQAELEHQRLAAYLAAIHNLGEQDPQRLREAAPLLSRSLAIKVDEKCLERSPELQAACLMQGRESLIMTDGHSTSVTQVLTSGPASDLAMEAVNTPQLKTGNYGPFVGSIMDIARLLDSFHTARYQYIPALASAQGKQLLLALNAPPSFHDPKSVLVAALPAVGPVQFPALRAADPKETFCVRRNPLILPVEGAPLVFAGEFAHDMTLALPGKDGAVKSLPVRVDPERAGFAVDTSGVGSLEPDGSVRASLQGQWGFDRYEGPAFQLVDARAQTWELAQGDAAALIVGREDTVHLHGVNAQCVASVTLHDAQGQQLQVDWKAAGQDQIIARAAMQNAGPGEMALSVQQYGPAPAQQLVLRAYAEAGHLESFVLHAGDHFGVLLGRRLDQVEKLEIGGVDFLPGNLTSSAGRDQLLMNAQPSERGAELHTGGGDAAHVTLKDGRSLTVTAQFAPPRPSAALIARSAALSAAGRNIHLAGTDEVPQDATLVFSLRARSPGVFSKDDRIEVATMDDSASAVLEAARGTLTLQNSRVAVATLDPAKALGSSAFGPLRFRRVVGGVEGDWHPLATLVRLPALTGLRCAPAAEAQCSLEGTSLFLLDAVSADAAFKPAVRVPDGFTAAELTVPRPASGRLYLKLRDDPGVISVAQLAVTGAEAVAPTETTGPDGNGGPPGVRDAAAQVTKP